MVHTRSKSLMLTPAKMHTRGDKYVNLWCVQVLYYNAQIQTPDSSLLEHAFLYVPELSPIFWNGATNLVLTTVDNWAMKVLSC